MNTAPIAFGGNPKNHAINTVTILAIMRHVTAFAK